MPAALALALPPVIAPARPVRRAWMSVLYRSPRFADRSAMPTGRPANEIAYSALSEAAEAGALPTATIAAAAQGNIVAHRIRISIVGGVLLRESGGIVTGLCEKAADP